MRIGKRSAKQTNEDNSTSMDAHFRVAARETIRGVSRQLGFNPIPWFAPLVRRRLAVGLQPERQ